LHVRVTLIPVSIAAIEEDEEEDEDYNSSKSICSKLISLSFSCPVRLK